MSVFSVSTVVSTVYLQSMVTVVAYWYVLGTLYFSCFFLRTIWTSFRVLTSFFVFPESSTYVLYPFLLPICPNCSHVRSGLSAVPSVVFSAPVSLLLTCGCIIFPWNLNSASTLSTSTQSTSTLSTSTPSASTHSTSTLSTSTHSTSSHYTSTHSASTLCTSTLSTSTH